MADTIRIKRRAVGGAAGAPTSLAAAEIAYNEQDDTLYYGKGNTGGVATSIIPIAGPGAFQPKDADLTALAALGGTDTIYYRSGVDTWSPVVVSTGLAFSGGNLTATAGGGNVSNNGTPAANDVAQWVTSTTIKGVSLATWRTTATFSGVTTFQQAGGGGNYWTIEGRPTAQNVWMRAQGVDANVGMSFATKAGGSHFFYTADFANLQIAIVHQTAAGYLQIQGGDGASNLSMSTGGPVGIVNANLSGTPIAPTKSPGDSTTAVATTAFVAAAATRILLNDYRPNGVVSQVIPVAPLTAYDVIEFEFSITPGGSSSAFVIQYSFDGGATYYNASGGYHCGATLSYVNIGTAVYSGQFGWPGTQVQFIHLFPGVDISFWGSGTAKIYGLNRAGAVIRPWLISSYTYSGGYTYNMQGSAACMGNGTLPTHIRFASSNLTTTFAAGSFIKVYGLK